MKAKIQISSLTAPACAQHTCKAASAGSWVLNAWIMNKHAETYRVVCIPYSILKNSIFYHSQLCLFVVLFVASDSKILLWLCFELLLRANISYIVDY